MIHTNLLSKMKRIQPVISAGKPAKWTDEPDESEPPSEKMTVAQYDIDNDIVSLNTQLPYLTSKQWFESIQ